MSPAQDVSEYVELQFTLNNRVVDRDRTIYEVFQKCRLESGQDAPLLEFSLRRVQSQYAQRLKQGMVRSVGPQTPPPVVSCFSARQHVHYLIERMHCIKLQNKTVLHLLKKHSTNDIQILQTLLRLLFLFSSV
jgi:hypothetical protein